ncbi:hypothetical protein L596_021321 [Steinernema carpocapsae]|uniref:Uncharacterized protein n=1 Tax=Steinernema carpocapsae TaxID=34508 RepID=A0A4U5MIC2_STECR|nr:hypothetical protein L596_021321 [Steinernema carpocapsae]
MQIHLNNNSLKGGQRMQMAVLTTLTHRGQHRKQKTRKKLRFKDRGNLPQSIDFKLLANGRADKANVLNPTNKPILGLVCASRPFRNIREVTTQQAFTNVKML